MKSQLRILHVEDSLVDRELILQMLSQEGFNCDVSYCDNREVYLQKLENKNYDLIFADCSLPDFSGFHALELARIHAPGIPFIFISGSIGEEMAIDSLRSGATDYVLKDRLSRLAPAVKRAIAEVKERAKITEMEERLRQAQRLEAVGTLAGGVAHDFNNILTIIKGHTSLLLLEARRPDRVQEIGATIDHAAQRGADLVSQLLAFARKSDGALCSTDINQRVREITTMLREAIARNINFELQLEDHLPEIYADSNQLDRVLINLATNARDAMPSGGKIIFATTLVTRHNIPPTALPSNPALGIEQFLCLRVTDTGTGMADETLKHIFEPFFTTKPKGKGTGLGMPVVYGLMQSHNGLIDIQTELGKGTSISLYFPIPVEAAPHQVEAASASPKPLNGTETVLVVDDEGDVSYFVDLILKLHGYTVHVTKTAEDALQILRENRGKMHLLFSDIGLAKLDGFALSVEARKIDPYLKVILTSGYADASVKSRMTELLVDGFIPKPYDMSFLLQNIRTVLDKH